MLYYFEYIGICNSYSKTSIVTRLNVLHKDPISELIPHLAELLRIYHQF
jgi:hypothetical protein